MFLVYRQSAKIDLRRARRAWLRRGRDLAATPGTAGFCQFGAIERHRAIAIANHDLGV